MPLAAAAQATLLKTSASALVRTAPSVYEFARHWWTGKLILAIGQARAGKTTFRHYLEHCWFDDQQPTAKTRKVEKSDRFTVSMGRDSRLRIAVQSVEDFPGQTGPVHHARLAYNKAPHAIMIFLDQRRPLEGKTQAASATWLDEFCQEYEHHWRGRTNRRLKSVIVVMNKLDRLCEPGLPVRRARYRQIIRDEFRNCRGRMESPISFMPCVMVTNPDGTKLVDQIIAQLARDLTT